MKNVISRRLHADKLPIDIDPTTGNVIGDLTSQFISTMGVYGRTKISILLPTWDHVDEAVKNNIWVDVTVKFHLYLTFFIIKLDYMITCMLTNFLC